MNKINYFDKNSTGWWILKNTKKDEQTIKCSVDDCKYNDCSCKSCNLKEINVCSCSPENEKEATMCDSYKKKERNSWFLWYNKKEGLENSFFHSPFLLSQ